METNTYGLGFRALGSGLVWNEGKLGIVQRLLLGSISLFLVDQRQAM